MCLNTFELVYGGYVQSTKGKSLKLDFSDKAFKDLLDLRKACRHTKNGQTIHSALRLLRYVVEEVAQGRRFFIKDHKLFMVEPDGTGREVVLDVLLGAPPSTSIQ